MPAAPPILLGLLGGAAIFAAGLMVGFVMRAGVGPEPARTPAPLEARGDDGSAARLARIEELLRELRHAAIVAPVSGGARTNAAQTRPPELDVRAELEALTAELRAARASTGTLARSTPAERGQGPGFPSVRATIENFQRLRADPATVQAAYDQTSAAFFFWRTDDVLLRFGVPTEAIAGGGGLELLYRLPATATEPAAVLLFDTLEGRVVNAAVEDGS